MSVARYAAIASTLVFASIAVGQKSIKWIADPEKGIAQAKQTHRPLMFYVLSSSARRDDDVERDQKRAFASPMVIELSQRFVPTKLSRSRNPELLEKWGLPRSINMTLVFTTPDGDKLDVLGPGGVANSNSLALKMSLVFKAYRSKLFSQEIEPKLKDEGTSIGDLKTALKVIDEFTILDADQAIIALLERADLNPAIRKACFDLLAKLSTRPAVQRLLEGVEAQDADAIKVLDECTPLAAEYMLDALDVQNPDTLVPVYDAVTKICKIKKTKPAGFWNGKNERIKNEEIQRVKEIVGKIADRWRKHYEDYR